MNEQSVEEPGEELVVLENQEEQKALAASMEELAELTEEQNEEAQKYAVEFIKHVIRLRGVKIEREKFLKQELRKLALDDKTIQRAIETTPAQAGVSLENLDQLAVSSINFETKKSAALSFSAGIPGGLAMLATVPADVTQYYVHAFRVMQKLAYVYGWQDLLGNMEDADDETVGQLALFLGVMMGVGGASASLTSFANQIARPALQKQITKQALTKTAWYPVMKKTLALVGVKVTKDSFAKTVTKAVPVVGGVVSGGMTLVTLNSQSNSLKKHLRKMPPPGVDAAEYMKALAELNAESEAKASEGARAALNSSVSDAAANAKQKMSGITGGTKDAAAEATNKAKGLASGMLKRGRSFASRNQDSVATAEPGSETDSE